jgi:uncharacterized membrane protein
VKAAGGRLATWAFRVGVVGKGVDGALEIVGGALLLALSRSQVHGIVGALTQHELSEDPGDVVARALLHAARHLSAGAKVFGAVYLLGHGVVKVGLVVALLRRRLWAYPTAILVFLGFLGYQLYRYSRTAAPWMLLLSAIDVFVIAVTWLEYRRLRASRRFA